jgi:hypothetical protein
MNIAQIRAKYPQYNDLSDKQLADALHGKFYSDLPIQDYYKRIGFAPETTVLGQVKEFGKGLIPGAVGLVEQAAIGASALLPEETEKAAREKIASIAGAAKAPFAAAPGYEESVGRKFGQAVGSTVPFLAAGPLGLAGRLGAVGLGVGAGAGEARTRAEESGATAEQRATATALGIAPGALEVFAPFRILSRIPDAATAQGVQLVKRALIAGGEEAAQEAASNFAQNLIAKGVYKPEQELIEGLGEAAAYGGATGAIVQGLLDLALGRRARAAQAAPTEPPIERAEHLAAEKAAAETPPPAPAPEPAPPAAPAAEEPAPPVGETPAPPPVAETPAPPVEEPKVRKAGEPAPLPDVLDAPTIAKIGFTRGSIHNMLVGKSVTDPEVREVLQTYLDAKREEGTLNPKTEAKINAFLARLPEAAAPTTAPAVPVTETPSADATQPEAGGAGAPVAGEPSAGAAPGGAGVVEPSGVVPPVADVEQLAGGEGQQPAPVTPPALAPAPAPAPAAPKEKGSLETRIKALNINAAVGGVPDLKVVREALESRDPKMYQAVAYYLGLDPEGNLLVGANNMPQTPSAQEAAQMAGLGTNSGDRVIKVAKALGITAPIIRKFQASQNEAFAIGRSKTASEAGTGADIESPQTALITDQAWYEPLARKGIDQANDTELARATVNADRFLENPDNRPVYSAIAAEVQKRSKKPEFVSALRREFGIASETATVEEGTPGTEEAVDEETETPDEDINYRTIPQSPVVTNRASHAELEKVVSDIGKALGGEVSVTILDDVTDVDAKQQPGSRAGALIKGQIYLFRSGIAKGVEGQKTVFHELFHKGLKNLLPDAEYRALVSRFYNQSAEIRRMADVYLASDTGKTDTKGMSPQNARVLAVEESLAEIAEQTKLKPSLVRQVGNFLARVADRFGMPQLARAIRTMGLNEQQKFIQDALQAGLGPSAGEGATRFRTVTPQTEEAVKGLDVIGEQDKRTFGQRVAQELKGNPALRLREKLADSLAPLEDFFVNAYGGATRTAAGRLNPMVLLSRALDALRVSKAAQEIGGLGREDGLIVAKVLPVNYKGILTRIADAAKERGQTYEEFRKTVDTVLYGHREYNLREKNKTLPKDEQIELLLKDHQIDRLEAAFQQDDFIKGISADLDTIRFNLLDTLVDTGRISAEQAQDYKDAIGYIPFERIGEYENQWNNATRGSNRGVAALKKMRSLEGSDRKSTSVVENFSGLMDWATKEAMKNEAALRALKDMELLGAAVKRPTKPKTDAPGDIVKVFDGGKETAYYVPDPAHFVAFSIADPQLSKVLKAFQRGSQVLRAGVTAMPPFAIKQVFDDVIRAYTYAGVKNNGELVKNVLFNFPKNWVNEVMRRESKGVRELKNLGIVGTFDFTQQTNLKDILEEAGAKKEGIGSAIIRVMEAGAKASDLAVREAIYKQVLKETGDKAQAESAAREIINFSRRGSSKMMGQMISIIPFFNAYARGMDKLATAAAGKVVGQSTGTARSMFYQRMGVLTAMGLAYALMMQDDEEYNKLPDHVRDTNWVLPYGKELGFTPVIPIPAELAFFFKAIPERIVRYYKYQGTEEEQAAMSVLGELTKRGIDVFSSPNVTPQVLRPFFENIVNYSWFLGRPLESQAQLQLRPFERYGTGTSDAMKAVARGLEDVANATGIDAFAVSPIKLENAVRGLMGTAAGLTLSMADMVVNPDRTDRPLHQQLAPQLTGASAVMKTAVGTRFMDEIYDLEKRVEQVNGTYNRLLKTQPEKAEGYLNDNIGIYSIRGPVQGIMDAIRTLNEAAMTIDRDTSLSPEERRKLIDELRVEQNEIARVVFSLRKQARDIQAGL